jgi:Uma2 family endonuclease
MSQVVTLPSQRGQPVWELAELYPAQGSWAEYDYLHLETNRLIEFSAGYVEVLPMPSPFHQYIVAHLYRLLFAFVMTHGAGELLFAPLRVRLARGQYREPDLVFISAANGWRKQGQYWDGADLVMEVVSPDAPERDTIRKRREYAEAGIAEYWIVNPLDESITVLTLPEEGSDYMEHGRFTRGQSATSVLLQGFTAAVSPIFDSAQ